MATPQSDPIVRDAPVSARQDFPRRIDALPAIVEFSHAALARTALDEARQHVVHFAIEELFTNMVKYAPDGLPVVTLEIVARDGAADVLLIDGGVDRFDPTVAPAARVDQPAAERKPGGLGLQLVRRTVDALHYDYVDARREGRTSFRVARAGGSIPC